ncbi:LegC family aminotransferase [Gammaproteobacteria bacterium]|nr:LegC family aminotransferase [Gammaproteobacteria bacterium]
MTAKPICEDDENIAFKITNALKQVCGNNTVALHEPVFGEQEKKNVLDCIESTFISSIGKHADEFESKIASYTGAKHAVLTVNGTSALHIALMLAGVQKDDEVLIPALTFIATANAVSYCNAYPHFLDSDPNYFGIDPQSARNWLESTTKQVAGNCVNKKTGRIIRAIIPMHVFGHPCELESLLKLAQDFNLALVEDAAESLGSFYKGRHTGTMGVMGVLSFNGNKIITTGGGGAILTNDAKLAEKAKHLTTQAKVKHPWDFIHDQIGYNYRMPSINAAIGLAQMEKLESSLKLKKKIFEMYLDAFKNLDCVQLIKEPKSSSSNYWLQTILLNENIAHMRDDILEATNQAGYMTRPIWTLMNKLPMYKDSVSAPLPIASGLERRIINIPSSDFLA